MLRTPQVPISATWFPVNAYMKHSITGRTHTAQLALFGIGLVTKTQQIEPRYNAIKRLLYCLVTCNYLGEMGNETTTSS